MSHESSSWSFGFAADESIEGRTALALEGVSNSWVEASLAMPGVSPYSVGWNPNFFEFFVV